MTDKFRQKSNHLSQGNGSLPLIEESTGVSCDTLCLCV